MKKNISNSSMTALFVAVCFCFVLSSCTTWYYQYEPTGNGVLTAGYPEVDDLVPEKGTLQEAMVEFLFTQAEKPMVLYYNTILDYMAGGHESGFMTKQMYDDAVNKEMPPLKKKVEKAGLSATSGTDYVKVIAREMAPGINKSIQENAYAYIGWGKVLDKEDNGKSSLSLGAMDYSIMIFPSKNLVRFTYHAPYATIGGYVQDWDVSGIDGFWDKDTKKIDVGTIKANAKQTQDRSIL